MLFVANHVPSYEIKYALEGNFFYPGSTVILSSNTIYLFYPTTKLVKQKFFYEKIIQIEKYSLSDKDLIILLFKNNKISYIYFNKEINEFLTYKLKFYDLQSEGNFLRAGKYNFLIKLNKHNYSFLDEKEIFKFKTHDKNIKNVRDIVVSDSVIKYFSVLCKDTLYFVGKNGCEKISFEDECLYLVKNENFLCIVGKYNLYLIKNKIIFKIRGNRFKVNYLNEEIIQSINQHELENKTFIKSKESTLTEENDEFSRVYQTSKTELSVQNLTEETILSDNMNINLDFSNSLVTSDKNTIFIVENNKVHFLKVVFNNHRITHTIYTQKNLPFPIKVNYFTVINKCLLINDYLFDQNLCSFNKFFTGDISFCPTNLEEDRMTGTNFSINFDKTLQIKKNDIIIKEISEVNAFHAGKNLVISQNNILKWLDIHTLKVLFFANFNNFDQKIDFYKTNQEALTSFSIEKNENYKIKEILCTDEFILLRNNLQFYLYRIINNFLYRITNNTLPILSEKSFYETKNYVFLKSKPMIFFKKSNFLIKKCEFSFDKVNFEKDILIKKERAFKIQEKIKKNSEENKKIEEKISFIKDEREGIIKVVSELTVFYREKITEGNEEEEKSDVIDLGAITKKFFLQFFTKNKEEEQFINEYEFEENEFVTSAKIMNLNDLQSKNSKSDFIVVTTSYVKSEEGVFRGRILIFEIIHVVAEENKTWTDRKLKVLAIEKCRGSVLDCCEVRGHIACCIGTRVFIYKIDRNEGLMSIAFHDTNILCVKVKSIKNYLVVGDLNGIFFLFFQIEPPKVHLLSYEQCYTTDLQLLIDRSNLFMVVKDINILKVFTYSPYNLLSKEGQYLIKRSEIDLIVKYKVSVYKGNFSLYEKILKSINFTGGIDLKLSLLDSEELITKKMLINEIFYEFINFSKSKMREIVEIEDVIEELRNDLLENE